MFSEDYKEYVFICIALETSWLQHNDVAGSFRSRGLKINKASTDTWLFSLIYSQTDFISRQNIQVKVGFV